MKTAGDLVKEINRKIVYVTPDYTIFDTVKAMAEADVGGCYVKKDGKIIGRWTERHLTRDIAKGDIDIKKTPISEVMHTNLYSAQHSASVYNLFDLFLGKRVRRLLIEKDGEYIGMLYVFDIIKHILQAKNQELKELNSIVSWEYYKRWGN
jgi:signal-transduction protein with cAMP-binding, CBS, and nucleotidyltransferase domain